MSASLMPLHESLFRASLCMADWQLCLGPDFDDLSRLLHKDIGRVAATYPADGFRLRVVTRDDRYAGVPLDDDDLCVDAVWLTVDDIQLWQFDQEKLATYLAQVKPSSTSIADKPIARVIGSFTTIILPSGKEMSLVRKLKRRTFIELVDQWCRSQQTDVIYAEQIVEDHNNALIAKGKADKVILTDRILHDLFRSQKDEFLELFEVLDNTRGHFRLKVTFVR